MEKRPDTPDFHWFVRDLMRVAVKDYNYIRAGEGYDPITFEDLSNFYAHWADPPGPGIEFSSGVENYELTLARWLKEDIEPGHLNVSRLESDWRLYLHGEKSLTDFDAEYCYDNLLLETSARTQVNGQALSEALGDVLPEERARYKGLRVSRSQELDKTHSPYEWVTQGIAAERLRFSDRWVRQLVASGDLKRNSLGKINYGSILSLLKKRGQPTYSS